MIDKLIRLCCIVLVTSWSVLAFSVQDAYTVRDVALKESASLSSSQLLILSKNTPVVILQRKGGWYQVSSGSHQGWLKLLSVRFAPKITSNTEVKSTSHYASKTTLTTGIRGLADGGPGASGQGGNFEQVKAFQANLSEASVFAKAAGLHSREVRYVEE